jgi:inosose dehydratase
MGCRHVVYADTSGRTGFPPISQRPRLMDDEWPAYGRKVTGLAERLAAFGVRMAFHHHMGTIIESEADIHRLMASTGEAAGLLFDSGHCLFAGADPAAVLQRHIARVVHVHCKDLRHNVLQRSRTEDMTFLEAVLAGVFTVPGDGCIAFAPLLRMLHDAGYTGWLVVEAEQDPRIAHPLTYAKLGYRNLSAMAAEAGWT